MLFKRVLGALFPLVGSNAQIDMERVIALKPDLLIVWQSGNTGRQLEQLGKLGIPVFYSEPTGSTRSPTA